MSDKKELNTEELENVNGGADTSDSSSIIDNDGKTNSYDAGILLSTLQSGTKK